MLSRVQSGVVMQLSPFDSGQRSLSFIAHAGASASARKRPGQEWERTVSEPSPVAGQREESVLPTQRLFGTMQWTPLRMSTIWLTRQSAASAVSA